MPMCECGYTFSHQHTHKHPSLYTLKTFLAYSFGSSPRKGKEENEHWKQKLILNVSMYGTQPQKHLANTCCVCLKVEKDTLASIPYT